MEKETQLHSNIKQKPKETRIESFGLLLQLDASGKQGRQQDLAQISAGITGAFTVKQLITKEDVKLSEGGER